MTLSMAVWGDEETAQGPNRSITIAAEESTMSLTVYHAPPPGHA
ncbi:MAG: hypothetical protein ACRED4_02615 [Brevundimonas sp.]